MERVSVDEGMDRWTYFVGVLVGFAVGVALGTLLGFKLGFLILVRNGTSECG